MMITHLFKPWFVVGEPNVSVRDRRVGIISMRPDWWDTTLRVRLEDELY